MPLRLFPFPQKRVRDPRAGYEQTLSVLRTAKETGVYTKSSIMLGLGEKDEEIIQAMKDLKAAGVDIFTLGQYLQVTFERRSLWCVRGPRPTMHLV